MTGHERSKDADRERGQRSLRLTVDCGNTRAKLVLWSGGRSLYAQSAFAWDEGLVASLGRWLDGFPSIECAGVSSVAASAPSAELVDLLRGRIDDVRLAPDAGLENRTEEPAGVGLDRLYAARGALELCGCSTIVLDAGTALTVDAVLDQGRGVFLGGAIAPGPRLLALSMDGRRGGAARLPAVEPRANVPALGRNTVEAMRSGIAFGLRGAARVLVQSVAAEAGLDDAPLVVTGGARAFLPEGLFDPRPTRREPVLVHRGLLCALAGEVWRAS